MQGTTYHIKFMEPPQAIDVHRLQADVERKLAEIDREMSTYRRDSEISRFNSASAGEWFTVSRSTAEVVAASRDISEKSGGAQDITVGPLVRLWHFGPPESGSDPTKQAFKPPSDDQIHAARARVGYKKLDVRMQPPALRRQIGGLDVDLSSIASGYTIDRLTELLRQRGIKDFMIELGGELRGRQAG